MGDFPPRAILDLRLQKPCSQGAPRVAVDEKHAIWEDFPAFTHFSPEGHTHITSLMLHCQELIIGLNLNGVLEYVAPGFVGSSVL